MDRYRGSLLDGTKMEYWDDVLGYGVRMLLLEMCSGLLCSQVGLANEQ